MGWIVLGEQILRLSAFQRIMHSKKKSSFRKWFTFVGETGSIVPSDEAFEIHSAGACIFIRAPAGASAGIQNYPTGPAAGNR